MSDLEQKREWLRAFRRRRRLAGQCYGCSAMATEGFRSCESCRTERKLHGRTITSQKAEVMRKWRARNPERYRSNQNRWSRTAYRDNPQFALMKRYRTRLAKMLRIKRADAVMRARELLGCTPGELVVYLERYFLPGMTWQNRGPLWHIDHKRPCASFDLGDPEQLKQCFHYTNLQPLWASDNQRKGAKYASAAA